MLVGRGGNWEEGKGAGRNNDGTKCGWGVERGGTPNKRKQYF